MKSKILSNKIKILCILSGMVMFNAYSEDIRIVPVGGGQPITCNYNKLTVGNGGTPIIELSDEGSNKACVVTLSNGPVVPPVEPLQPDGQPHLISPLGTITVAKPAFFSWIAVPGAKKYLLRISKDDLHTYIRIGEGSTAGNPSEIDEICSNNDSSSGGLDYCKYIPSSAAIADFANGTYDWTVRVRNSGELDTPYAQKLNFTVAVQQVLTAAEESSQHFENDWTSLYYNPSNGENDYGTKEQLKDLIGRGLGGGYQPIIVDGIEKEVFILNISRDETTIIPSCANGQDFSFFNTQCQQSIPFQRNEIYALRGRTKTGAYTSSGVSKDSGQLYAGHTEKHKVVISPFPGEMDETRQGSFSGDCTAVPLFGYFNIDLKPSGDENNTSDICIVPPDTNFYVNVELLDEASRSICDTAHCQFDIQLLGVQQPLEF